MYLSILRATRRLCAHVSTYDPLIQDRGHPRAHLLIRHLDTLAAEQLCRRILPVLVLAELLFRHLAVLDLLLQRLGVRVSDRVLRGR